MISARDSAFSGLRFGSVLRVAVIRAKGSVGDALGMKLEMSSPDHAKSRARLPCWVL